MDLLGVLDSLNVENPGQYSEFHNIQLSEASLFFLLYSMVSLGQSQKYSSRSFFFTFVAYPCIVRMCQTIQWPLSLHSDLFHSGFLPLACLMLYPGNDMFLAQLFHLMGWIPVGILHSPKDSGDCPQFGTVSHAAQLPLCLSCSAQFICSAVFQPLIAPPHVSQYRCTPEILVAKVMILTQKK